MAWTSSSMGSGSGSGSVIKLESVGSKKTCQTRTYKNNENWLFYQYLPLSGIRPIPSFSKCLSNSSTHLSRLSLYDHP